jgi:hypothetical protein
MLYEEVCSLFNSNCTCNCRHQISFIYETTVRPITVNYLEYGKIGIGDSISVNYINCFLCRHNTSSVIQTKNVTVILGGALELLDFVEIKPFGYIHACCSTDTGPS